MWISEKSQIWSKLILQLANTWNKNYCYSFYSNIAFLWKNDYSCDTPFIAIKALCKKDEKLRTQEPIMAYSDKLA